MLHSTSAQLMPGLCLEARGSCSRPTLQGPQGLQEHLAQGNRNNEMGGPISGMCRRSPLPQVSKVSMLTGSS